MLDKWESFWPMEGCREERHHWCAWLFGRMWCEHRALSCFLLISHLHPPRSVRWSSIGRQGPGCRGMKSIGRGRRCVKWNDTFLQVRGPRTYGFDTMVRNVYAVVSTSQGLSLMDDMHLGMWVLITQAVGSFEAQFALFLFVGETINSPWFLLSFVGNMELQFSREDKSKPEQWFFSASRHSRCPESFILRKSLCLLHFHALPVADEFVHGVDVPYFLPSKGNFVCVCVCVCLCLFV